MPDTTDETSAQVAADLTGDAPQDQAADLGEPIPAEAPAITDSVAPIPSSDPSSTDLSGDPNVATNDATAAALPIDATTSDSSAAASPAPEVAPVGESSSVADQTQTTDLTPSDTPPIPEPVDTAATDGSTITPTADPPVVPGYRILWIDHGAAAMTYETANAAMAMGFALGILRDGRVRDVTLVDEETNEERLVRTDEEVLAFTDF